MTNEKTIMCLEDMKIKVPIPKAAKQARENNEALDVAIKALKNEPHWIPVTEEPTDRMICYVTLKDTNDENRQNWVAEMIYTPWDGFDLMDGIEAIAWMPKQYPEPYKGETE